MQIEYEATFENIDKDEVRDKLVKAGAKLIKPETLYKRETFKSKIDPINAWMRVRDEGDKITMSHKVSTGDKIDDQKEICLTVDNFENAVDFLDSLGYEKKAFQETKREIWNLEGVEITIDEWPFLEPFVEVEGESEEVVKMASEKIGFDYSTALFCAVGILYKRKYGMHPDEINNLPGITFDSENPFLK